MPRARAAPAPPACQVDSDTGGPMHVLAALLLATVLVPASIHAQESFAPPAAGLQIEAEGRRLIVHPRPSGDAAVRDAERTTEELGQRRREDELIREVTRRLLRRPDLDYDVRSGVQGRHLQRLLPR